MEKSDLTPGRYDELTERIFDVLAEKGPGHTSMDSLSRHLGMSKRTLYEIFGSKDDMIRSVLSHLHGKHAAQISKIKEESGNVMEAISRVLALQQRAMSKLSGAFFRDLDDKYSHIRNDYESTSHKWNEDIKDAIILGIRQGVFRKNADYDIIVPLMRVQMESLKRMEEFFPPEITISQAYNAILTGVLRSIATPEGIMILDKLTEQNKKESV